MEKKYFERKDGKIFKLVSMKVYEKGSGLEKWQTVAWHESNEIGCSTNFYKELCITECEYICKAFKQGLSELTV